METGFGPTAWVLDDNRDPDDPANGEDCYPANGKEAIITEDNATEVNFDLESDPLPAS